MHLNLCQPATPGRAHYGAVVCGVFKSFSTSMILLTSLLFTRRFYGLESAQSGTIAIVFTLAIVVLFILKNR